MSREKKWPVQIKNSDQITKINRNKLNEETPPMTTLAELRLANLREQKKSAQEPAEAVPEPPTQSPRRRLPAPPRVRTTWSSPSTSPTRSRPPRCPPTRRPRRAPP